MKTVSERVLDQLRAYESPNMLAIEPDGSWPIVWDRARGTHVWDAEGRRYLDLTAAFGVAAAGHANPRVVSAGRRQMSRLPHAMGDVHPHAPKARLARELSRVTFERWTGGRHTGKTIFNNAGFEAVEAALKTALLATGRQGIVAFEGAYHGLGYGALNATHRPFFRDPFRPQLREFGHFVPFPKTPEDLKDLKKQIKRLLDSENCGAILAEPIQARGGINVPPAGFLPMLRACCDQTGALLVLDEIYTGFGRAGTWFACEDSGTIPDLICLGKALTGGFPLSVCVGRADIIDAAWPPSAGEAIHTSTFQGNPVGCAMALAQIAAIRTGRLPERSAQLGRFLLDQLHGAIPAARAEIRGRGLMAGVELKNPNGSPATERAFAVIKEMLRRGFILLPEGRHANVISFTPPLTISRTELAAAVRALGEILS
ncbi:MAG TPA: aspartate aminotransferase family protein [Candidatus Baltobacteraceae bacterium]|jgi:4-aminobutyrate aminotransferase-like enzyme|nr:aspartate aminotransferase family protein [Candidatus Baltobacteraceae bacterium]